MLKLEPAKHWINQNDVLVNNRNHGCHWLVLGLSTSHVAIYSYTTKNACMYTKSTQLGNAMTSVHGNLELVSIQYGLIRATYIQASF